MRKHFEVFMIRIAIGLLMGRNVARCKVVSRRDNNDMWYMGERLSSITKRMLDEYNDTSLWEDRNG